MAEVYDSEIIRNLSCTQHQSHCRLLGPTDDPTIPWLSWGLHASKVFMERPARMPYPWTVIYPISRCLWLRARICMGLLWWRWFNGHLYYHTFMYLSKLIAEKKESLFQDLLPQKFWWYHVVPTSCLGSRYKQSWTVGIYRIWWISNNIHPTGRAWCKNLAIIPWKVRNPVGSTLLESRFTEP